MTKLAAATLLGVGLALVLLLCRNHKYVPSTSVDMTEKWTPHDYRKCRKQVR